MNWLVWTALRIQRVEETQWYRPWLTSHKSWVRPANVRLANRLINNAEFWPFSLTINEHQRNPNYNINNAKESLFVTLSCLNSWTDFGPEDGFRVFLYITWKWSAANNLLLYFRKSQTVIIFIRSFRGVEWKRFRDLLMESFSWGTNYYILDLMDG